MSLTDNQKKALSRVSGPARQKLLANFVSQNANKGKQRKGGNGRRSRADMVLTPGVGRIPSPYAATSRTLGLRAWDAFDPAHAPLPRATGPYTVIRTTRIVTSADRVMVFTPCVDGSGSWSSVIGFSSAAYNSPVNGLNNTRIHNIPVPGTSVGQTSNFTLVPAAISIQIMNPEAL